MTNDSGPTTDSPHPLRRHRHGHYVYLLAAVLIALLVLLWAQPGRTMVEAYSVSRVPWGPTRVTVPINDEGRANLNLAFGTFADRFGSDGEGWRQAKPWMVEVGHTRSRVMLRALQTFSRGALRFRADDEQLAITLDPNRFDAVTRPWRSEASRYLEKQFPEWAQRVHERFTPRLFEPTEENIAQGRAAVGTPLAALPSDGGQTQGEGASVDGGEGDASPAPAPLPAHVIVLVHGLDEPGVIWDDLRPALLTEGYTVVEFNYPNDGPIDANARRLDDLLALLHDRGVSRVSLIAHSMGGLVSLEQLTAPDLYASDGQRVGYPTVDRLITVGTPWYGSPWARLRTFVEVRDQAYRLVSGDSDILIGGWFDGLGEAYVDLLRGSDILTAIHSRPRPHNVPITVIAGRSLPVSPDALPNLLTATGNAPDSLGDTLTALYRGIDQTLGDGAVPLSSAYLKSNRDYHLVHGDHHTIVHSLLPNPATPPPAIPIILERLAESR